MTAARYPRVYDARMTASPVVAHELEIVPLTPDRLSALGELFDEGGDPRWCWCAYVRARGRDWTNSTAADNRALLSGLAEAGPAPGLVAFLDGRAVGWVSLGPRADYERLAYSRVLAPVDDRPVWSIVCFVVSRRVRGRGIATALLGAAIAHARTQGARTLEAYPVDVSGARIPAASAYHGTLSMFTRAGFAVAARRRGTSAGPDRPIVRLELG